MAIDKNGWIGTLPLVGNLVEVRTVRWGLVASSLREELHAPFRSGIEMEDYQLDPLVRALKIPK